MAIINNLRRRVAQMRSQAANLRPAVEEIGRLWRKDRQRDFDTQGATTAHGPWRPNALVTIKNKGHARVLRGVPAAGYQLMHSIVKRSHPDHIFRWDKSRGIITLGTSHWKARIHQLGLSRGGTRRPIDPALTDRRRYADVVLRWIMEGKL